MNGRIDTRPKNQWQVTAGMRGVHKGMRGNVIGGYAPDGRALGTKANNGGSGPGKLASQAGTPGLDRLAAMNPKMPAPGQTSIDASRGPAWKSKVATTPAIPKPPAPPVDRPMSPVGMRPKAPKKWWNPRGMMG